MSENTPDPTEDEIREACGRIQSGWSEAERERRRGGLPKEQRTMFVVPLVRVADLASS